jgi:mannose-6-phosphate isomerase-like protein (cupin superfamily)
MEKINLSEKFHLVDNFWSPRIVAELNGQYVKLAKFKGEMVWHSHENEDEFFHVISGEIKIHLRDRLIILKAGECFVVRRGVEHKPEAEHEAQVLLFEPKSTEHTGSVDSELTVPINSQDWI